MSEELKPCPFCGWHPMLYIGRVEFTDAEVECECGANVGNYPTENEAIEAWNKRVSDASQARLSEAVKVLEPFRLDAEARKIMTLGEDIDHWPIGGSSLNLGHLRAVVSFLATLGEEK